MTKPSDFIESSDYASLANDDNGEVSVTFPGSQSIPPNTMKVFSTTINLGSLGSSMRWRICSNKDSNKWFVGAQLQYDRNGSIPGTAVTYSIIAVVTKTSPTAVTVLAIVLNPYSDTLITEAGDETFQLHANTFVPPFD